MDKMHIKLPHKCDNILNILPHKCDKIKAQTEKISICALPFYSNKLNS